MSVLQLAPTFAGYRAANTGPGIWITHSLPTERRRARVVRPVETEPYRSLALTAHEAANDWIEVTGRRMAKALSTPTGWDGPHSKAIPKSLAIRAYKLLRMAMEGVSAPSAPYIVPCADGSLQLEWHLKETELELYFEVDGSLSAWVHNRETGHEIEAEGAAARGLFFRWAPELSEIAARSHSESLPEEVFA